MDEKLLKKLLNKSDLIRYYWLGSSTNRIHSAVEEMENAFDRQWIFEKIMNDEYELNKGIYLYHYTRCYKIKLVGIVNKEGVKEYV